MQIRDTQSEDATRTYQLKVSAAHQGMRLDTFLSLQIDDLTRSQAKRLIEQGVVHVEGREAKPSQVLGEGQHIDVQIPPPSLPASIPQELPLDILYEDADIIVVNKAAGMVVHPAAGHPDGTLVNALLAHCKDLSGVGGELKAGIVHRLDQGTSGVMIAAKNDAAHLHLADQFQNRTVGKIYGALVFGMLHQDHGIIDQPLGRSRSDRKRISSHTTKGRVARTEWRVLERFGKAVSWLLVTLHTGRTHQIRVHLAEAGHPLVGDPVYGGERKINRVPVGRMRTLLASLDRPALHAWRLEIAHPRTGERMRFEAPLPEDLQHLLNELHALSDA